VVDSFEHLYYCGMVPAAEVDVEQELASVCGELNQSYARLVALVSRALVDESWAIAGVRSADHWLIMRAGLSPARARTIVAVARRREQLPAVIGEFGHGQLSVDQVAVVARYAPAHVEASVAELAVNASVPQLSRALSRYSFDPPAPTGQDEMKPSGHTQASWTEAGSGAAGGTDAGGTGACEGQACEHVGGAVAASWNGFALVEDRAGAPAELSMSYDQSGRFLLRFSAPADLGALVEAALSEAKDSLFRSGRPAVTWAEALVEITGRHMGAVDSANRRDAFRVYVHLDTDGAWLSGRPRLPVHIAEKLTCEGVLQPVWTPAGSRSTSGAPSGSSRSAPGAWSRTATAAAASLAARPPPTWSVTT
jgi:hypothetical protein